MEFRVIFSCPENELFYEQSFGDERKSVVRAFGFISKKMLVESLVHMRERINVELEAAENNMGDEE